MNEGDYKIVTSPDVSPPPPRSQSRCRPSTFLLPFAPLVAGMLNDLIIYSSFIDSTKVTSETLRNLAYFDIVEKLFLGAIAGWLMFASQKRLLKEDNHIARDWLFILFFGVLFFEVSLRYTGNFGWMGNLDLEKAVFDNLHVQTRHWDVLPIFGMVMGAWVGRMHEQLEKYSRRST
jgi:hypothetical protein